MNCFTTEELLEAKRSIASTKSKCEKALEKLAPGTSQHTLTIRRIKAFAISLVLLDEALSSADTTSDTTEQPDENRKLPVFPPPRQHTQGD